MWIVGVGYLCVSLDQQHFHITELILTIRTKLVLPDCVKKTISNMLKKVAGKNSIVNKYYDPNLGSGVGAKTNSHVILKGKLLQVMLKPPTASKHVLDL